MVYKWDASLATGNAAVDSEHMELIRQLSELLEAMKSGQGRKKIEGMLVFLAKYVDEHFRHEEAIFARLIGPEKEANLKAHAAFKLKLKELMCRFDAEGPSAPLTLKIRAELADWLVNHIQGIDAKLGSMAKAA